MRWSALIAGLAATLAWLPAAVVAGEKAVESVPAPGGAFNLRVVSDSVPDWSSRENFVRSALSGWPTDHEKALAQFIWSYRGRRVTSPAVDDGRPVGDPILFFNSYGGTFCSYISYMNCALWEAWGRPARPVTLSYHCVAEVHYGGAWHLFDNDFCNYFLNEKGEVASAEELATSRVHGNVKDLKPGEFYVFDHCPTASFPRGRIFMGPSSWSLIEIARDWYPNTAIVKPRLDATCARAGHRYVLGLRPNESYTRHWRPLGTGAAYAHFFRDGKDPAAEGGTVLRNCRSNGEWTWKPDLSDPATLFASENVECGKGGIRVKDEAKPASATFRAAAANVVTSAHFAATVTSEAKFKVSGNGGLTWEECLFEPDSSAQLCYNAPISLAGRLEYLFKVEMPKGGGLQKLELTTVTQVNPRTLPALRLGRNEIVAVSDSPLETIVLVPRLNEGRHAKEVAKAANWQVVEKPVDHEATLRTLGNSELVLRATAPRDIKRLRMAANVILGQADSELIASASFDGGKTWRALGKKTYAGSPVDHRASFETDQVPAGTRDVLLRYFIEYAGNGLDSVLAEVGYEPAGGFMPYDLSYSWSEWRDGKWLERRHAERVGSAYHRYAINVGGERPPRMNWVRIASSGAGKLGYSDGEDVGDKAVRPAYRLAFGKNLSAGCKYEASRPASAAFPDKDGRLLTDGYVGLASFWGLDGINLEGKKNEKRVGELAVWAPGEELAVTVDLGGKQTVGGARICAVGPNQVVRFPEKMTVELSTDGKKFAPAGEARWEDCFFPPGDLPVWEGADSPIYDHLQAGGIIDHAYVVALAKPVKARYVRFRLAPQDNGKAAMGFWELEVYDRIEKQPWDEHLRLPEPPAAGAK